MAIVLTRLADLFTSLDALLTPFAAYVALDPLLLALRLTLDALLVALDAPLALRRFDPLAFLTLNLPLDALGTLHLPLDTLRTLGPLGLLGLLALDALRTFGSLDLLALHPLGALGALDLLALDALGAFGTLDLLALLTLGAFDVLRSFLSLRAFGLLAASLLGLGPRLAIGIALLVLGGHLRGKRQAGDSGDQVNLIGHA